MVRRATVERNTIKSSNKLELMVTMTVRTARGQCAPDARYDHSPVRAQRHRVVHWLQDVT